MVIGGFYNGTSTEEVQSIDLENGEVSALPSMNSKRFYHACSNMVMDGSEVVVVAGKSDLSMPKYLNPRKVSEYSVKNI